MQSAFRRVSCAILAASMTLSCVGPAPRSNLSQMSSSLGLSSLPDPLIQADGRTVTTPAQWRKTRRPELIEQLASQMYGRLPGRPAAIAMDVFDIDRNAFSGRATRKQIAIFPFGRDAGARMDLLLYVPNQVSKPPVILGLNFWGNATVTTDSGVHLGESYVESPPRAPQALAATLSGNRLSEASRGFNQAQWPIEEMLDRGYAFATAFRSDVDPDLGDASQLPAGFQTPWRLRPEFVVADGAQPGAIATWAWACSRAMDYLESDADIDARRVALFGFSRLGKAVLWSAAIDDRFAAVISSESGSGGAKLFHHVAGEDIARLNNVFPHWFCPKFRNYIGKENTLPFDAHFTVALLAPRPVYAAASEGDAIFDPIGEYEGLYLANPVYRLLGAQGLPDGEIPSLNQSVLGSNGYHRRSGRHDVTAFDWAQYFRFLETALGPKEH